MRAATVMRHLSWHAPRASRAGPSPLTRIATWAIAIEAVVLVGLGVAGLDGVAHPRGLPPFAASQTVGYLLITVLGLVFQATSPPSWWLLNPADHVLHASLFALGLVLLLLLPATPATPSSSAGNAAPDV